MATAKQTELIGSLLGQMSDDESSLCKPIIQWLLDLGYTPGKHKKSTFVVAFEKHGRIIAKMEVNHQKKLVFWLRFSACSHYSQVFQDAVKRRPDAWIKRNQEWVNHDISRCCGLCKGNPRFYHHINDDGSRIDRCGGYTLIVPGISHAHLPEILQLIKEQDDYFTWLQGSA